MSKKSIIKNIKDLTGIYKELATSCSGAPLFMQQDKNTKNAQEVTVELLKSIKCGIDGLIIKLG